MHGAFMPPHHGARVFFEEGSPGAPFRTPGSVRSMSMLCFCEGIFVQSKFGLLYELRLMIGHLEVHLLHHSCSRSNSRNCRLSIGRFCCWSSRLRTVGWCPRLVFVVSTSLGEVVPFFLCRVFGLSWPCMMRWCRQFVIMFVSVSHGGAAPGFAGSGRLLMPG